MAARTKGNSAGGLMIWSLHGKPQASSDFACTLPLNENAQDATKSTPHLRLLKLRVSALRLFTCGETLGFITTRSVSEGFTATLRKTQKHNPSLTFRVGMTTNAQLQNLRLRLRWVEDSWQPTSKRQRWIRSVRIRTGRIGDRQFRRFQTNSSLSFGI